MVSWPTINLAGSYYTTCCMCHEFHIIFSRLARLLVNYCKATFLLDSVSFRYLSLKRMIGTARHNRGLYLLDDDTSSSSQSELLLLSTVMFGDHTRSLPPLGNDILRPLLMTILVLLGFSDLRQIHNYLHIPRLLSHHRNAIQYKYYNPA